MKSPLLWTVVVLAGVAALWWGTSLGASPTAPPPTVRAETPAPAADAETTDAAVAADPLAETLAEPLAEPLAGAREALDDGDRDAARAALDAATDRTSTWHALSSELARLDGDLDAARAAAEQAVELDPTSGTAQLALSRVLRQEMAGGGAFGAVFKLGAYKSALQKALELDPDSVDARMDQIGFLFFAPGIAGGDVDEGLELARALATTHPREGATMVVLGLARDERPDEAMAECRAALERFPDHADLHATLAGIHAEREEWEEADRAYGLAVERGRGPARFRALYARARMRVEGGWELEEAIAMMREYAAADPRGDLLPPVSGAHWRIGLAHEQLGRTDEARAAYEESLRLDPAFESAQEALAALDG